MQNIKNIYVTKRFLKYFFTNFFPLLIILFAVALFIENSNVEKELFTIKSKEKVKLSYHTKLISSQFEMISSDLIVLAESSSLNSFIEKNSQHNRCNVEKLFLSFSRRKKLYDQIRFIDTLGNEKIRINFNNGKPLVVPANKLQNKGDRYYFKNTIQLGKGIVFISPFDLNVENGKIEEPLKPMIRFGIPVFDYNNKKRGIVIINYLGDRLLDDFRNSNIGDASQFMLLNSEGYWLYNSYKDNAWGFMYKAGDNLKFQSLYGEEWKKILHNTGQFQNEKGLFTFSTIYPLEEIQNLLGETKAGNTYRQEYFWEVVSIYPQIEIDQVISDAMRVYRIMEIITFVVILILSLFIARIRLLRIIASEKSTAELEKLSHALEHAPVVIEITDTKGNIEYVNPFYTKITGYTVEEVVEQNLSILKEGSLSPELYEEMWQTLEQNKIWHKELTNKRKNDEIYWESVSISPVINSSGKTTHYVVIKEDITERKEHDAELIEAKIVAEAGTEAKSRFLASMSHEIRTPMNAIIGFAHLALDTELNPKQLSYLKKINFSAKALLDIINDILDFSKIEANELALENIEFNLEEVVTSVSTLISQKVFDKELELILHISPKIPQKLIGDPLRLRQILTNFCNNAVKFTKKGEIIVEITSLMENKEEVELLFSVKDTGIGIKEGQKNKLFKAFQQADTSTTREFGGTGLGLVISENLARLMRGKVWFKSEENKGSTFYFSAKFKKQQILTPTENLLTDDLRETRVMLFDNNPTTNRFLTEILGSYFTKVTSVKLEENLLLEFAEAKENPYQLLIVDCRSFKEANIERLRYLKNKYNVPILMIVSPSLQENVIIKSVSDIVDSFLFKPVNYSDLFNSVMEIFGKTRINSDDIDVVNKADEYKNDLEKIKGSLILLAEDNEINQQVAAEMLASMNITVEIAKNGLQAVEMIASSGYPSKYSLVLMDVQMPEMDGITATSEIRKMEFYKSLPIIAMTADAMEDVRQMCLNAGMDEYLTKPIEPNKLAEALTKWIPSNKEIEIEDLVIDTERSNSITFVQIPHIEGVDILDGLKFVNGNKKLFVELLKKFVEEDNFKSEVEQALKNNDVKKILRVTHILKGNAKVLGMNKLENIVSEAQSKLTESKNLTEWNYLSEILKELVPITDSLKLFFSYKESRKTKKIVDDTRKKLNKLKSLLELRDMEAMGLYQELGEVSGFESEISKLGMAINKFQFEQALEIVLKLLEEK